MFKETVGGRRRDLLSICVERNGAKLFGPLILHLAKIQWARATNMWD
jgi:hypothetical protein